MQPWIQWFSDDEATGKLADQFELARKRAGRVFNIIRVMSLNPYVLESMITSYLAIMKGRSPLDRAQREMLAMAVSRFNGCHY